MLLLEHDMTDAMLKLAQPVEHAVSRATFLAAYCATKFWGAVFDALGKWRKSSPYPGVATWQLNELKMLRFNLLI